MKSKKEEISLLLCGGEGLQQLLFARHASAFGLKVSGLLFGVIAVEYF